MSFLKKLFGSASEEPEKPSSEGYKGFRVTPQPMAANPGYRICALIEKDVDGQTRSHTLIRADTLNDMEGANQASVEKARQMIDQQGDGLFD